MPSRTIRTIGASLVLAGLGVAGAVQMAADAGVTDTEIGTTDTTPAAAPSSAGSSTPGEPAPFVYRLGLLSGVSTDNYWAYYGDQPSVWNSYVLGPTKPALFSVDTVNGALEPELATEVPSPTWDSEGWQVTVELAPDFGWSDGEPITARDFVFTFETVRGLGLTGSWVTAFPDTIESVHADSDLLLRIEFTERPNLAVWPNGVGLAPVMPEHIWRDVVDRSDIAGLYAVGGAADISGGPLVLTSVTDALIVSNANPGYPKGSVPSTVEYYVFESESEMLGAISSGEIDSALSPNGIAVDPGAARRPGVAVLDSPANAIRYLGFNLTRAPMNDPAFRTALALLIERRDLAETLAVGEPAWSFIPTANVRWFDEASAKESAARFAGSTEDRLSRALDALSAAGYQWDTEPSIGDDGALVPGAGLTIGSIAPQPLTILTPGDAYDPARPSYVEAIADALGVLGFDARPVETDFDTVVDLVFDDADGASPAYDMYMLGWTLGSPALPAFYRPLFSQDGEMNNTGYASAEFENALASYENAYTIDDARQALWEMEQTLSVDLPYLLLYSSRIHEVYRADRVEFDIGESLGGLQARLGGIGDVRESG